MTTYTRAGKLQPQNPSSVRKVSRVGRQNRDPRLPTYRFPNLPLEPEDDLNKRNYQYAKYLLPEYLKGIPATLIRHRTRRFLDRKAGSFKPRSSTN
jgi:hypothetical protein